MPERTRAYGNALGKAAAEEGGQELLQERELWRLRRGRALEGAQDFGELLLPSLRERLLREQVIVLQALLLQQPGFALARTRKARPDFLLARESVLQVALNTGKPAETTFPPGVPASICCNCWSVALLRNSGVGWASRFESACSPCC